MSHEPFHEAEARDSGPEHVVDARPHLHRTLLFHDCHPHAQCAAEGEVSGACRYGAYPADQEGRHHLYIYIGKPFAGEQQTRIQLNDKFADADQVTGYVMAERRRMQPDDAHNMTVDIKADRHTDMGTITDVKQALRKAQALKIHYSAVNR